MLILNICFEAFLHILDFCNIVFRTTHLLIKFLGISQMNAEVDNDKLRLVNSSYHVKTEFINSLLFI